MTLRIEYLNGTCRWFPVPPNGWKLDPTTRCILVGRGPDRVFIPLDNVTHFQLEED